MQKNVHLNVQINEISEHKKNAFKMYKSFAPEIVELQPNNPTISGSKLKMNQSVKHLPKYFETSNNNLLQK